MNPANLVLAGGLLVFAVTFWRDANEAASDPRYVSICQRALAIYCGVGALFTALVHPL